MVRHETSNVWSIFWCLKLNSYLQVMELNDFAPEHIFDEMEYEMEEYKKNGPPVLVKWRHRYEPFVYDCLKQQYGDALNKFWKTYDPPQVSDKAFVLVERRCHANLWFLLRNIAYFGQGWSIYLFCSRQNFKYCKAILGGKNVHLIVIFEDQADAKTGVREYNELLKQASFWERIDAEHICVFEMDCYLRKHIPEELLEYDYVGTPWGWNLRSPGGSGLSLRKKSVMIDICTRKVADETHMQDSFAAEGVCELGYDFLHSSEGVKVFVESYYTDDPIGVHQWWTFFFNYYIQGGGSKEMIRKFLTLDI